MMRSKMGLLFALTLHALIPAQAKEDYHWVQYTATGLEGRAATDASACPAATIDGAAIAMTVRSEPGPDYPVRVCAMPIPKGAKTAAIAGVPLVLPKPRADRILVIGDTGCRLKGPIAQSCNDLSEWPFRLGADVSSILKPDLVLHVGDFHYRESACPLNNAGCAGSPFGDTWDVWRADFFVPGDALLKAAPWIMVRGNHEECERGGKGWARALDPYAYDFASGASGCLGPAKPYHVDIGGVTVMVMDVAFAADRFNPRQAEFYREQFVSSREIAGPTWLTFHRPIWAMAEMQGDIAEGDNKTLAAAARDTLAANVQMLVSGHIHTFMALGYVEDLPAQLISGHGGDELVETAPAKVAGLTVNGVTVKSGVNKSGIFGFSMLERDAGDATGLKWTFTGYDVKGQAFATCKIDGRKVACD